MQQTLQRPTSDPTAAVRPLKPEEKKLEKRLTLFITLLPFLGLLAAVPLAWQKGLTGLDVGLFLFMYIVTGFGVTIGFHRLFTHRSFQAHPALKAFLAIAGSMALQGPVIKWVGDHRRHHAFADAPGDPHSPHLEEAEGVVGVIKGLWHSHVGWLFEEERTILRRFAPDLIKDPVIRKIDALFPLWAILSFTIAPAIAFAVTLDAGRALSAFLWASLARIFLLHHVTWSINSICHFYGKRPFESGDLSTNNWPLAVVSFGESWHNNHHAFPSAAKHGLGKGQIDPSGAVISVLAKLGLAWNLKGPSIIQIEMKSATGKTSI